LGGLTVAGFIEAVPRVAVRREDGHPVPAVLEGNSGVDDQPLGTSDAQIWMDEDCVLCVFCHVGVQ